MRIYKIRYNTKLTGLLIMLCSLFVASSMGNLYSGTPVRSERLELLPEEGFLEIEFGASSRVMRELLGYPTGVFLIGLNQVHVYGNRAMFFFKRDEMYKYVLGRSLLHHELEKYIDEDWPFEETTFVFPAFDLTLGGVYSDIKDRLGTERGLELPGSVVMIKMEAVEIGFRFIRVQGRNVYLLSEVVVEKN